MDYSDPMVPNDATDDGGLGMQRLKPRVAALGGFGDAAPASADPTAAGPGLAPSMPTPGDLTKPAAPQIAPLSGSLGNPVAPPQVDPLAFTGGIDGYNRPAAQYDAGLGDGKPQYYDDGSGAPAPSTPATPPPATPSPSPTPPATPSPSPAGPVGDAPPTPDAPSLVSPQVFAGDASHPGSGYVTQNGQQYRIEGTTAAGQGRDVGANDSYILDDGHGGTLNGPNVNVQDYNAFLNQPGPQAAAHVDPSLQQFAGQDVQYGNDGSVMDAKTGKQIAGPDPARASAIGAAQKPTSTYTPPANPTTETRYLQGGLTYGADGKPLSSQDPNSYNALGDLIGQTMGSGGASDGVLTPDMLALLKQNPQVASALPSDEAGRYGNTLSALGYTPGTGGPYTPPSATPSTSSGTPTTGTTTGTTTAATGATGATPATSATAPGVTNGNGTGTLAETLGLTGSGGTGTTGTTAPIGASADSTNLAPPKQGLDTNPSNPAKPTSASTSSLSSYLQDVTSPAAQYASVTPTDPTNDLRSQTITPGPALDRFKLAQDQLKTYNDATSPYYDAALRAANQQAAASGRLGSGMLRTSLGDLANQRDLQLQTQGQEFLQNALDGSQTDARANLQELLAEQQYQTSAQNQAFNQDVTGTQLQDALTNSAFGRGLSSLTAGNANDPSSMLMMLSGLYGNQASSATNSLAQLVGGTTANNRSDQQLQTLLQYLQAMSPQGARPTGQSNPNGTGADDGQ